jgi:hypothetical protein
MQVVLLLKTGDIAISTTPNRDINRGLECHFFEVDMKINRWYYIGIYCIIFNSINS